MARSFIKEFTDLYPNTSLSYASKAFLNKYIAQIDQGRRPENQHYGSIEQIPG